MSNDSGRLLTNIPLLPTTYPLNQSSTDQVLPIYRLLRLPYLWEAEAYRLQSNSDLAEARTVYAYRTSTANLNVGQSLEWSLFGP